MQRLRLPDDLQRVRRDLLLIWVAGGSVSVVLFAFVFLFLGLYGPALVEATYLVFCLTCFGAIHQGWGSPGLHYLVQMLGVFVVTYLNTQLMGGWVPSGGFIIWSIICPIAGIVYLSFWPSVVVAIGFIVHLCTAAAFDTPFSTIWPLPFHLVPWFFVTNTVGAFALAFASLWYFFRMLAVETRQREEAQTLALRAQKLESVGTLAGGIAHDFNNILMAMFGNLALAKRLAKPGEPLAEHLIRAEGALQQAASLTSQLLAFSRGGAAVKRTVSLTSVIAEASSFVLHGTSTQLAFDIDPRLWKVEADSGQIAQLLGNLVLNSHQATAAGGRVLVSAHNFLHCGSVPGLAMGHHYVHISVADNGCGIPSEHRDRIFEPFFTTRAAGTGLGLASCFAIVREHNGLITVDSKVGQGSTFHVFLPSTTIQSEPFERRTQACIRGQGHILVMDDEAPVREVLAAMMEELGYQVTSSCDGAQAVEVFKSRRSLGHDIDVVVLDLTVRGGMGGVEAAKLIQQLDPSVPIIASSGYIDDRVMSEYELHGFSDVLVKPYTLERLCVVLAKAVAHASSSSQMLPVQNLRK